MKRLVVVAVLVLAGCSTAEQPLAGGDPLKAFFMGTPQAKSFSGPDGRKGYSIECAGGVRASECFDAASNACGGEYELITRGQVGDVAVVDVLCGASRQK